MVRELQDASRAGVDVALRWASTGASCPGGKTTTPRPPRPAPPTAARDGPGCQLALCQRRRRPLRRLCRRFCFDVPRDSVAPVSNPSARVPTVMQWLALYIKEHLPARRTCGRGRRDSQIQLFSGSAALDGRDALGFSRGGGGGDASSGEDGSDDSEASGSDTESESDGGLVFCPPPRCVSAERISFAALTARRAAAWCYRREGRRFFVSATLHNE